MITVSIDCGSMVRLMGSETARDWSGIVMDPLPLNVKVCDVPGMIALTPAEPLKGRATVTAVIRKSAPPNAAQSNLLAPNGHSLLNSGVGKFYVGLVL